MQDILSRVAAFLTMAGIALFLTWLFPTILPVKLIDLGIMALVIVTVWAWDKWSGWGKNIEDASFLEMYFVFTSISMVTLYAMISLASFARIH